MFKPASYISLLFLAIIFLSACDRNRNHPGHSYFPDMANSRAYESYTANPNFADNLTARLPVKGTIPRGMIPYTLEKSDENRELTGKNWDNPLIINEETLIAGKKKYEVFCIYCHGEVGDGQGYLVTSGRYPYQAANLLSNKMKKVPDGEIFHVISVGWGIMGAHASQISQEDRWRITAYVKNKLQKIE
ncbi:cytochrome c [Ancylomarina euxinus]|uniref:Cytochrome c n=1 Tax=Ancylomarina euxinus TaxID=2283627 RepID=A0A425Y301_9BACT|nr:cytochrome c [Ancylomarina euxinus]MCZ4693165.1 cytochrome c [Ancylomarina euxinus]MUP15303.1 cytochrome c [Ancylomarina euxinus]RRG22568.1 cytochrome c [Ancylomarina euxinus]